MRRKIKVLKDLGGVGELLLRGWLEKGSPIYSHMYTIALN